ncbi:MAG: prepilin peptidase [Actinomycetota bacterium]
MARAFVATLVTSAALSLCISGERSLRVGAFVAGVCFACAALVDLHEHRLPNQLVAIAAEGAFVGALCTTRIDVVLHCLLGGVLAGGAMAVVRLVRGVGMGDVKMAGAIGMSLGTFNVSAALGAIAIAAFVSAAYGVLAGRYRLPLGPSLWFGWAAAAAVTVVGGWA